MPFPASQLVRHVIFVVCVACLVLFTNLGKARLWDRDEPRNAGCAAEMLDRNDWVVPVFNGELRDHKPVLLYWFMMSAYAVFGVNEFAARFWSAVLAVGTTLLTYGIGRRLFDAHVGFWAALILVTSLMFGVAGRAATPDSPLIFFSTAAVYVYVVSVFPRRGQPKEVGEPSPDAAGLFPSWPAAALMYAMMGMAVLAKGPVGLVLPTAVIGMFLLIMRLPPREACGRWLGTLGRILQPFFPGHFLRTCWAMRPLTALSVSMAIALPWYLWVGMRTDGDFLGGFLLEHNVGRAMQPMEGHRGGLLYYPVAALVGFFPWSILMAPMLIDAAVRLRRGDSWKLGYLLAFCWIGVYVGLFSLAQTKLPSYITPAYPALALLAAVFLVRAVRGQSLAFPYWPRVAFGALAVVGVAMMIGLPLAAQRYLPGEQWLGLVGLIPLIGGIACIVFSERQCPRAMAASLATTATLLITTVFGLLTVRVDSHQQSHRLLEAVRSRTSQPQIATYGGLEPSWVFYAGEPLWVAQLNGGTTEPLPDTSAERLWNPKPRVDAVAFLAASPDRFIITTSKHLESLRDAAGDQLPQLEVLEQVPFFLKKEDLMVVGWNERAARLARSSSPDTVRR